MNPITLIENYKNLVKSKSNADLKEAFKSAMGADFEPINFTNIIPGEKARVFLGYDSKQLYAILVRGTGNFTNETYTTMPYYISNFKQFRLLELNNSQNINFSNPNEINYTAYKNRVELYKSDCLTWFDESIAANKLVEYFEISLSNFKNNANNKCVLGLYQDTTDNLRRRIDLVTVHDVYMDVTRPVPPFKPTF